MKNRKKSMLAGGLGVLATFVWIPQFLARSDESAVHTAELSAEVDPTTGNSTPGDASALLASAGADQEPGPWTSLEERNPDESIPEKDPSGQVDDALGQLSGLESSLAALTRRDSNGDLAALFARLSAHEETGAAANLPGGDSSMDGSDPRSELAAFAAANPLTGLIHRSERSVALLGHRVVRAGDRLLGGRITVTSIGPGGIELRSGAASLTVELEAFRARPSTRTTEPASTPPSEGKSQPASASAQAGPGAGA